MKSFKALEAKLAKAERELKQQKKGFLFVLCESESARLELIERYKADESKICVIYNLY